MMSLRKHLSLFVSLVAVGLALAGCRHAASAPEPGAFERDPVRAARALTKAGRPVEALEAFDRLVAENPDDLAAHRGRVESAYAAGRLGEYTTRYQRLAADPARRAVGLYGLALARLAADPGQFEVALSELAEAEAALPQSPDVPYTTGLILWTAARYPAAAEALGRALKLDPQRAATRVALARTLVLLDRESEALELLRSVLELEPSVEEVARAQAITAAAFDPLRDAPTDVAPELRKAVDLLAEDQIHQALVTVNELIAHRPELAFAYTLRGLAHSRLDNNAEAIVAFERALELNPNSPSALVGLGDVHLRLQHTSQVAELYDRALALDPFYLEAHRRQAELAAGRGDWDLAARAWSRCLRLEPANPANRRALATALAQAGRLAEAVAVAEEALARDENDLESLVRAAQLRLVMAAQEPLKAAAHKARAREYLERAVELAPDNQAVAELLEALER